MSDSRNPDAYERHFYGVGPERISQDDVRRIQSLDLREKRVQQALAGFLARGIHEGTNRETFISPKILEEAIGLFVAAMNLVPDAAEIINRYKQR